MISFSAGGVLVTSVGAMDRLHSQFFAPVYISDSNVLFGGTSADLKRNREAEILPEEMAGEWQEISFMLLNSFSFS
jgi:hypothetical protein